MKKNIIFTLAFAVISCYSFGQITISTGALTTAQYVNNLVGPGIAFSNVTYTGTTQQIGAFGGTSNIGFASGVVISSGATTELVGPASFQSSGTINVSGISNADLLSVANLAATAVGSGTITSTKDAAILEFDFVPVSNIVSFNFVFSSEEYLTFVNTVFNDVFGFFVSGPGITGPYASPAGFPNGSTNLALVPGTNTPITISTIHPGLNSQYYVNNTDTTQAMNGFTTPIPVTFSVICGETYHFKFAVADCQDNYLSTAVFMQSGSFSSAVVDVAVATVSGDTTIVEGCNFADIFFTRPEGDLFDTLSIIYTIGGTATEGIDYANLMDTILFLPGVDTVILNLTPLQDNIIEGYESVIISVNIINPCGDTVVSSGTIYVWDGPIIDSLWSTNANCLPTGSVHVTVVAPLVPATYLWTFPDSSLTFSGSDWQNINPGWYYITVTQAQCSVSDSVEVLLTAPPLANFSVVAPLSNCQPAEFSFVNNSLNATSYNWAFGDGNGSAGNNPSHTYSNQTFGTYTVQLIVFVDPLCASDTTLTINLDVCACIDPTALNFNALANVDDGSCIYPFPEVFAPNVFTPNSDAENPTYFLSGKNLVSLELTILNRWGSVVFSKSSSDLINNNPAWDGKINGDLASDGIYFYIYKVTGITNQVVEGHGFLHLISDK
jgi:gliding motility-associated-like protein